MTHRQQFPFEEYRRHLQTQDLPAAAIEQREALAEDLSRFLASPNAQRAATRKEQVEEFSRKLIRDRRNKLEYFHGLVDYAGWLYRTNRLGDRELYVALIEVMDCHNALEVLAGEVEARHSRDARERIFPRALPPLGASEVERCASTREIAARMEQQLPPAAVRDAWFHVQHGIPAEAWREQDLADQEKFRRAGSIDTFLDLKRQERDTLLTQLRDEKKLWYTVEIDNEVLEFVKSDPEMEVGQRQGDRVYISKIPYNAKRYLHEADPRMKRFYACHCPLLREAIRNGQPISPEVCNCSLGHASHYLAGLGRELKGEVLESAVRGDPRCRFVFYL